MAVPTVPQRPARSQNIDVPTVPARPRRAVDRSISPSNDRYARSPLNDPVFLPPHQKSHISSSLSRSVSRDLPQRPPSVTLPSVGQEGSEYANFEESDSETRLTKIISGSLPLHAPKAALPASTAKARVAAVTRTDSDSAAAVGLGRPSHESKQPSQLGQELSRSSSAQARSRPGSIYKQEVDHDDHGIPEIGQQIPLLAYAGDVQAPTPAPQPKSAGSYLSSPGPTKNHFRTKSGREVFRGPPGSYGMHGHGHVDVADPFEKAWYEKHPEARAREAAGEYGPAIPMDRKEYNLSSADLNKLVHSHVTDVPDRQVVGTPDEHIGYLASEEYAQRLSRPASAAKRRSIQHTESPLRKAEFTPTEKGQDDDDEDHVIHVDHPHLSLPAEGNGPPGPEPLNPSVYVEQPILAEDEVRKRPSSTRPPAVASDPYGGNQDDSSRNHSRSNSFQQHQAPAPQLHRFSSTHSDRDGTPLEGVKEYEPLFPEEEDESKAKKGKKPPSLHDGEGPRHHFPSKDVWEDVPDSVHYETTVLTPQVPKFSRREAEHEPEELFESVEAEEARSQNQPSAEELRFNHPEKKPRVPFNKDVAAEIPTRPSYRHRFPSQDTWEDTPDSAMITTTVDPEDPSQNAQNVSPVDQRARAVPIRPKPQIPARPAKTGSGESPSDQPLARSVSKEDEPQFPKVKPPVPARPAGSKISALRGAFMNDLESRLKVGPQAVQPQAKPEPEEDQEPKAPLADARKGRARGPARRKPGQSPGDSHRGAAKVSFVSAVTIWEIDEEGSVSIPTNVAKVEKKQSLEPVKAAAADKDTQTGQMDIEVPATADKPAVEKATIFVEGRADGGSEMVSHTQEPPSTGSVTEKEEATASTST